MPNKLLDRILRGTSDANIPFDSFRSLLRDLGFDERIKGRVILKYRLAGDTDD